MLLAIPLLSTFPSRSVSTLCPAPIRTRPRGFGEKGEHVGGTASRPRRAVSDSSRVFPAGDVRLERRGWGAFTEDFHEYSCSLA